MVDLDNMVQALDNALYVSYDGGNETFYVWHGGHTINLYDAAWNALDAISTGDFKSGITTPVIVPNWRFAPLHHQVE